MPGGRAAANPSTPRAGRARRSGHHSRQFGSAHRRRPSTMPGATSASPANVARINHAATRREGPGPNAPIDPSSESSDSRKATPSPSPSACARALPASKLGNSRNRIGRPNPTAARIQNSPNSAPNVTDEFRIPTKKFMEGILHLMLPRGHDRYLCSTTADRSSPAECTASPQERSST